MVHTIQHVIKKYHLLILLCIVGIIRLSFIGQGYMSFPDEDRYIFSLHAVEKLFVGDIHGFWENIFSTAARPGDTLINTIPAAIQIFLQNYFSIPYLSQFSFIIVKGIGNIFVSLLIVFFIYKISVKIFHNRTVACVSTLVYALLVNSNIYIRHLFPYDMCFLFYIFCLYVCLMKKITIRLMLLVGCLSGFAYTIYPGYFWFNGILLLLSFAMTDSISKKFLHSMFFVIGNMIPIFLFELLSFNAKYTYFHEMYFVSLMITQGSFAESLYFGQLYLYQVESFMGIAILFLLSVYLLLLIIRCIRKQSIDANINRVMIPAIMMYCLYVVLGAGFHRMVFYGRILHGFMPFAIWGSFAVIDSISSKIVRNLSLLILILLSFISFGKFYIEYQNIGYPYDILTRYHIKTPKFPETDMYSESAEYKFIYETPSVYSIGIAPPIRLSDKIKLVNFHFFWPVIEEYYFPYAPEPTEKKILSVLHFQSFPAYTFEGFLPEEREILMKRKYMIQIYENE
jgi:hypothetical protein